MNNRVKHTCKLAIVKDGQLHKYSYNHVKLHKKYWLEEFRKNNGTDDILARGRRDRYYEEYMRQINDFLNNCGCKITSQCLVCPPEDHEGDFCRCESRNIQLAKEKRSRGESPWCNIIGDLGKVRNDGATD